MILSKKAIKDKIINSEKTKYYKGINVKKYDLSDEKFILSTMNNRSKRKLYRYMKTKKNLKSNQHLLLNFFDKLFNRKTNDKLKTHVRNCIITPSMINKKIYVYNGNSYSYIELQVYDRILDANAWQISR